MRKTYLLIAAGVAVVVIAAAVWYLSGSGIAFLGKKPTKTAAIQLLVPYSSAHCQTFAPDGWVTDEPKVKSTMFTAVSADHKMIADYAIVEVSGALARGGAGQQPTPPAAFVQQFIPVLTGAPIESRTDASNFGDDQVMTVTSGPYGGYVLYRSAPIASDPGGYAIVMRVALGAKEDKASIGAAGSVAAAARCFNLDTVQHVDAGSSHGTGITAGCAKGSCTETDVAGTYNAQFGTGWVHDAKGRNYDVDVDADYSEDGPDGPGYYATIDGNLEKLAPGLQ